MPSLNADLDNTPDIATATDLGTSVETAAQERTVLEEKTKERLQAIFNDDDDVVTGNEGESGVEDNTVKEDVGTEDDTPDTTADEDSTDEDDSSEITGEAATDENDSSVPTLPESYRRSLKAYGWDDAEIDQNLRVLGSPFIATAAKIHDNRNQEVTGWANAGRQARQADNNGPEAGVTQTAINPLAPVDAAKLKETYGEDDLVDAIVGPVNATVEAINSILPQLQNGQMAARNAEVDQVSQQVEGFFGRDEMSPYTELYGSTKKGLTDVHLDSRNKVLDAAYDLIVGAQAVRGQNLPLAEALNLAHGMVSHEYTEKAARNRITSQTKERSKGRTLKPSRATPLASGSSESPRDRDELLKRTRQRMRAVFG